MSLQTDNDRLLLDRLVDRIDERLHPVAVLLYGTAAAGRLRADSDLDLAVLIGGLPPDPFEVAALRTNLEADAGRSVDLVVLDTASPILAMEVLRCRQVLRNRQPELLQRFVVRTLAAYFDLKRTRLPIERALRRETVPA